MAKKRVEPTPPAKPLSKMGRPKLAAQKPRRPVAVTLRAGDDWLAWLDKARDVVAKDSGFAKPDRTELIDHALSRLAVERGMTPPPSRY